MAKDTISRHKRGIFLLIYNFLFGPTESQDIKQLKQNVAILIENQNIQQPLIETNSHATDITRMHIAKNKHMINGQVYALKHKQYCLPCQFRNW